MTAPNRRLVREAIGAGVVSATATLTPVPVVYDYLKTGFEGESPIVRVWSESAQRPESRTQNINNAIRITIQVWVLVDENATDAEQAASEDMLDNIEVAIANWVIDNTQTTAWNQLHYERPSLIQSTLIGPYTYLVEQISLLALVGGA
jgi:hypothetical protein